MWEAIASIGASAIGGLFGNKSNKDAAKQAQLNRDWQERMDNTKHQREVADLTAAGLNPILSAQNGGSVPSGATAAQTNPMSGFGDTVTSALKMNSVDKKRLAIEQQQTNANEAHLLAQANKANAEYDYINENRELTRQNTTNAATDNLIKSYTLEKVMPEQAALLRSQSKAAIASAGASSASAALDNAREAQVKLELNKRSKSQFIEPDAEYLKVITEGVSNSAGAVNDVTDTIYNFLPWRKGFKKRP